MRAKKEPITVLIPPDRHASNTFSDRHSPRSIITRRDEFSSPGKEPFDADLCSMQRSLQG